MTLKDPLDYTEEELNSLSVEVLTLLLASSANLETLFNTRQLTEKTLMNALYGALANKWFPLFNEDIAAAITGNGRYFIRKLAIYIEDRLQELLPQEKKYIVYGDTDSVYYQIEPFVEKFIKDNPDSSINDQVDWADKFEIKIIQPVIQKVIDDFCEELNSYNPDVIGCEREIIADTAVFTAKKKYYARVRDSEGTRYPEDDPYIKVMGLDIIKSSTSIWSKKYLKEAVPHILDKDELSIRDWLRSVKQEYVTVNPNLIAGNGGVSRLDYDLVNDIVPFGSRAAIRHNMYIKENGLDSKYAPINAGDKCKRLHLTLPNKFNSNIIAYTNEQFVNEIDCIDYDTNFEKGFMKPLGLMVNVLNYKLDKETEELDDW
jgi:hypothetical protein